MKPFFFFPSLWRDSPDLVQLYIRLKPEIILGLFTDAEFPAMYWFLLILLIFFSKRQNSKFQFSNTEVPSANLGTEYNYTGSVFTLQYVYHFVNLGNLATGIPFLCPSLPRLPSGLSVSLSLSFSFLVTNPQFQQLQFLVLDFCLVLGTLVSVTVLITGQF